MAWCVTTKEYASERYTEITTNKQAVEFYRELIASHLSPEELSELRGKNLACWCRLCDRHAKTGLPLGEQCHDCELCHADVLLELANR